MEMHVGAEHVTHEAERVPRSGVLLITAITLVFAALLGAAAVVVWNARTREPAEQARGLVQPGTVVSNIRTDEFQRQGNRRGSGPGAGEALRAKQRASLSGFGWADESRANVRIPIEEAMELELRERR